MTAEPPLRIGLLTPAFSGATAVDSGIGAHFRHLADALTAEGHHVTVALVTERPANGISTRYALRSASPTRSFLASVAGRMHWQLHQWVCHRDGMRCARKLCRTIDVDIWETTSTGALAHEFLRLRSRAPVVTRISTTAAQLRATNAGPPSWIQSRIERWEHELVHRSDRAVTHSFSHRDHAAAQFGLLPTRIALVPHGIPVPPQIVRRAQREHVRLLFVGRMEQRKGIDLLLAALPPVLQAVPTATVTLVGADRDRFWEMQWRKVAPPALLPRVTFAGVATAEALEQHYANADIFVAPSRYESFGLMFVEAMARALPVVALRTPGAIDLIDDKRTGMLAPAENPAALATTLIRLATDPAARHRLGDTARSVVEQRYSLPVLAGESTRLYREVLRSRSGKSAAV